MIYRLGSLALALVCLAATIALAASRLDAAPSPPPGPGWLLVGDGWVPPDHPAAKTVATAPATPAASTPIADAPITEACDYISPYTDRPACVVGDYRIGHVYAFGPVTKGLVIGLSMASDGAEVVTLQEVYDIPDGPRQFWAFVNDGTQRPWEWRRP